MTIPTKQPLSDVTDSYLNMEMETMQKRLLYHKSIWAVKEIDFIEVQRKLQVRIATLEQEIEAMQGELAESSCRVDQALDKCRVVQGQARLLSEEKDRIHRDSLSLQKQLDYYKGETESLQKRMKDADNVLSEKMTLTRQVIALQLELENERRATARTTKNAAENRDSEKSLQKEITELKAQLTKQIQLTEKAKAEASKIKEDWEKQKNVLDTKLEQQKAKNKALQEKSTGPKRKASDGKEAPPLLSPMKPSSIPPVNNSGVNTRNSLTHKPVPKKAQTTVSEFSTTPFFARQGSVIPQPSPSIAANASIVGRSMPVFGGTKSKRVAAAMSARPEEPTDPDVLGEDTSLSEVSANTSVLTDTALPKKKKRKLNGGMGNRTLLAVPDESPAHGLTEFGVSTLMLDSPATRPKFGGNNLLSTVKKSKGGFLWNLKKGGLKLDKNEGNGPTSPEKGNDKMKDIKKGFTLKL